MIAFIGSNAPEVVGTNSIATKANCATTNVGKVTDDKLGICYDTANVDIEFLTGDALYILLKGKAAGGTPFVNTVNSVPIKRDEKYIVIDKFYTAGNA